MNRLAARFAALTAACALGACALDDEPATGEPATGESALLVERPRLVPLYHWYDATAGDNQSTSDGAWAGLPGDARSTYRFSRVDAWIYDPAAPAPAGTVPVYGWFSAERGDYFATTDRNWVGRAGDTREGYHFRRVEGYVHAAPTPGTVPLNSWWNATVADNVLSADPAWSGSIGTIRGGYRLFRLEGHAFAGDTRADLRRFATVGLPTASGAPQLFRHQAGTRRCQAFAVIAALESAYAHTGIRVDLSEQFLGVLAKMLWLHRETPITGGGAENQLGIADGGGGAHLLKYLESGLRIPEENAAMPFIDELWPWSSITDPSGNPWSLPANPLEHQKRLNDFNLGPLRRTVGGAATPWRTLPATMLDQGRTYGASSVRLLCERGCAGTVAADYERVLREGHEIVVDAFDGNHVMLLVGYDRTDPANAYFLVKNSYGFDGGGEDGFLRYAYSDLPDIVGASYIETLRPVAPWRDTRFLGRWNLSFDGHRGELDIYHLPGSAQKQIELSWGETAIDRRLGTFRDTAGRMVRVNGQILGDRLTFYLDVANPAQPWDARAGRRFEYILSGRDTETMAGVHVDGDGTSYPGYARKSGHVDGVSAADGTPFSALRGTWEILVDGRRDRLTMHVIRSGAADYRVSSRYEIVGAAPYLATIDATSSFLTVPIGPEMTLRFAVLNHQQGTLAGTMTQTSGTLFRRTIGAVGRRIGP